jgi:hypothetical protein
MVDRSFGVGGCSTDERRPQVLAVEVLGWVGSALLVYSVLLDTGPGADTMVHLRLSRTDWEASGQAASVKIGGFEGCRPLFGL